MLLINVAMQTGSQLKKRQMPRPSSFVAIALLFFILSVVETFGKAKIAVTLGALITLTIAFSKIASIQSFAATGLPTMDKGPIAGRSVVGSGVTSTKVRQRTRTRGAEQSRALNPPRYTKTQVPQRATGR